MDVMSLIHPPFSPLIHYAPLGGFYVPAVDANSGDIKSTPGSDMPRMIANLPHREQVLFRNAMTNNVNDGSVSQSSLQLSTTTRENPMEGRSRGIPDKAVLVVKAGGAEDQAQAPNSLEKLKRLRAEVEASKGTEGGSSNTSIAKMAESFLRRHSGEELQSGSTGKGISSPGPPLDGMKVENAVNTGKRSRETSMEPGEVVEKPYHRSRSISPGLNERQLREQLRKRPRRSAPELEQNAEPQTRPHHEGISTRRARSTVERRVSNEEPRHSFMQAGRGSQANARGISRSPDRRVDRSTKSYPEVKREREGWRQPSQKNFVTYRSLRPESSEVIKAKHGGDPRYRDSIPPTDKRSVPVPDRRRSEQYDTVRHRETDNERQHRSLAERLSPRSPLPPSSRRDSTHRVRGRNGDTNQRARADRSPQRSWSYNQATRVYEETDLPAQRPVPRHLVGRPDPQNGRGTPSHVPRSSPPQPPHGQWPRHHAPQADNEDDVMTTLTALKAQIAKLEAQLPNNMEGPFQGSGGTSRPTPASVPPIRVPPSAPLGPKLDRMMMASPLSPRLQNIPLNAQQTDHRSGESRYEIHKRTMPHQDNGYTDTDKRGVYRPAPPPIGNKNNGYPGGDRYGGAHRKYGKSRGFRGDRRGRGRGLRR